jgi:hypothetical protein
LKERVQRVMQKAYIIEIRKEAKEIRNKKMKVSE